MPLLSAQYIQVVFELLKVCACMFINFNLTVYFVCGNFLVTCLNFILLTA